MTDMTKMADVIEGLGRTWDAFKEVTDRQSQEIRRSGDASIETKAQVERINAALDSLVSEKRQLDTSSRRPPHGGNEDWASLSYDQMQHKASFQTFLRKGNDQGLAEIEKKALSVGSDPDGGYMVPVEMSDRIVRRVEQMSTFRTLASSVQISTEALEGLRDVDEAGAGWTTETGARGETASPTLGKWRIAVAEMYAEPRATQTFLDDAAVDVESWLSAKIADRFARLENTAFVSGDGVAKPRGFASYPTAATADAARSWGTIEHVASGANGGFAASSPADVLFDLVHAFKQPYLTGASWIARRQVIALIRKLKASDGSYLWQPGLQQGQPATLLDFPVVTDEDMPALGTGALSLALGNFREAYQIVDRIGIRVLRDPYTAKPYVKFYATKRVGGDVVNFEAVKFVKFSS